MRMLDRERRPGSTRAADPDETLAAVAAVMERAVLDVERQWQDVLEGSSDVILGQSDLPVWLDGITRSGGKQIRPLMCHWGYVCSGDADPGAHAEVVQVGAALELLHVFALIHDDVMDESATRRGGPSAHRVGASAHAKAGGRGDAARYGESMAVLLGDLAHAMADHLVGALSPEIRRRWFELSVELIAGQREDLSGAAVGPGDRDRARRIARIKSGAYTVTRPLQLGAVAGHADERALDLLQEYGTALGDVFAARDDLLGVWGDPEQTGKPSGDDLRLRKPTTLWVDAQDRLDPTGLTLMARIGTPDERPDDVAALQDAMVEAGVRSRAEQCITDGAQQALAVLDRADGVLDPEGIAGLIDMTHLIAWRTS